MVSNSIEEIIEKKVHEDLRENTYHDFIASGTLLVALGWSFICERKGDMIYIWFDREIYAGSKLSEHMVDVDDAL